MAFSPPVVGCLVKKADKIKGGVTGTPGPPLATPLTLSEILTRIMKEDKGANQKRRETN